MAYEFLRSRQDLFMQPEPESMFEPVASHRGRRGWMHVRLQQTYEGIPVEGAQVAVHFDADNVPRVINCSHFVPALDLTTTAAIDESSAATAALQDIGVAAASGPVSSDLVIYPHEGNARLAWKVQMFVADPLGNFVYYIDATDGGVIDSYNNLMSALDREVYDTSNTTTLPGALQRSEGQGVTGDASVDAAYDNAGTVYNYFNTTHGRDGIDGAGATIVSTVHYDTNLNNAFWNGTQMVYGDGDGVIFDPLALSLDVVAHELVHGVTQYTSNLVYQDESGALNESLSDIFAALIDPDWEIGEDVYTPGIANDALRDLSDPTCCNQPDHYDDLVTPDASGSSLDQACNSATNQDNGCVHYNSGIPNKAAYLMSVGGTFSGISVAGMGNNDMGDVWYEAQVNWLTSSDGFAEARQATIDAATALFGGGDARVTSVENAWAAVGVGVPEVSTVPSTLAFGNVDLGSFSDISVTLSNPGDVDLIVSNITSDDAQFVLQTGTSFTVSSGGSATITVRYTPDLNNPGDDSGNLTITHNAANSPTTLAMTGSGAITLSVSGLNFGDVRLGNAQATTITLTNPSTAVVNVTNVTSSSTYFTHDAVPPFALGAGGGTANINVTFRQSRLGRFTGQLLITHNPTISITLIGGKPIAGSFVANNYKASRGVPFGAEYVSLLLAWLYGAYAIRRRGRGQ